MSQRYVYETEYYMWMMARHFSDSQVLLHTTAMVHTCSGVRWGVHLPLCSYSNNRV